MSKKVLYSKQIFANQVIASGVVQSIKIKMPMLDNISVEIAWTGTPVGTFQVLASVSGINYNPVQVSIKPASGSADSTMASFPNQGYQFVLLQYTRTSGSGVLNAWAGGKEN